MWMCRRVAISPRFLGCGPVKGDRPFARNDSFVRDTPCSRGWLWRLSTGKVFRHDLLLFGREIFLFDGSYHHVVGVDHFCQVDFADFGKKFVGVKFGEAVVGVNPGD